ncbi:DUF981 family protein [Micromonospora sp. LOL_023]|uniref:DUF981 family protein n=1 Tax=Micromonospora sp. LOL_023 TaxID=3345418 RepID=UPI003A85096E
MFNNLMGVCAGLSLLLVPRLWAVITNDRPPLLLFTPTGFSRSGWSATFGILGTILTLLGFIMTIAHPLSRAKPYIDSVFGEPCLLLGIVLLAAAVWLACTPQSQTFDEQYVRASLAPIGWIIFATGIVLLWCTLAIVRFDLIGSAPQHEPITGLLHGYPVENVFFAVVLYGPSAVGCLLFPAVIRGGGRTSWLVLYWCWTVAGAAFLLFSAINYYTHAGMLVNEVSDGTVLRW